MNKNPTQRCGKQKPHTHTYTHTHTHTEMRTVSAGDHLQQTLHPATTPTSKCECERREHDIYDYERCECETCDCETCERERHEGEGGLRGVRTSEDVSARCECAS